MDMLMAIAIDIIMATVMATVMAMEVNKAKGIIQQRPRKSPNRG